jgi:hypothetical protein
MLDRIRKWLKPEPAKADNTPAAPTLWLETRCYCPHCGNEITRLETRSVIVSESPHVR